MPGRRGDCFGNAGGRDRAPQQDARQIPLERRSGAPTVCVRGRRRRPAADQLCRRPAQHSQVRLSHERHRAARAAAAADAARAGRPPQL